MNTHILKITDAFLAYQANKTTLGELTDAIQAELDAYKSVTPPIKEKP